VEKGFTAKSGRPSSAFLSYLLSRSISPRASSSIPGRRSGEKKKEKKKKDPLLGGKGGGGEEKRLPSPISVVVEEMGKGKRGKGKGKKKTLTSTRKRGRRKKGIIIGTCLPGFASKGEREKKKKKISREKTRHAPVPTWTLRSKITKEKKGKKKKIPQKQTRLSDARTPCHPESELTSHEGKERKKKKKKNPLQRSEVSHDSGFSQFFRIHWGDERGGGGGERKKDQGGAITCRIFSRLPGVGGGRGGKKGKKGLQGGKDVRLFDTSECSSKQPSTLEEEKGRKKRTWSGGGEALVYGLPSFLSKDYERGKGGSLEKGQSGPRPARSLKLIPYSGLVQEREKEKKKKTQGGRRQASPDARKANVPRGTIFSGQPTPRERKRRREEEE